MKRLALILVLAFALPAFSYAQDSPVYQAAPVEISSIRAQKDNVWYYVHRVLPKQTLYSICRAYDVTQQEVYEANRAALETGLKAGMDLYIPYHENETAEPQQVSQTETAAQQEEVLQAEASQQEEYTTHRVKWYENLSSIARKYGISPATIMKANSLTKEEVQTGQILKIPTASYRIALEKQISEGFSGQDLEAAEEEEEQPEEEFVPEPFSGKARIALLLPFKARSASPSSNYLDFYSGVLLALERIKAEGVDADLKVIDISDYSDLHVIASDEFLGDRDFVIGPVMSEDIAAVADYCNLHRIPLISPMDQQAERLAADNPSIIQAPVSSDNQTAKLIESMHYSSHNADNVLVIREKSADTAYFNQVGAALVNAGIPFKTFSYGILEGRDIDVTLSESYLDSTKANHVIIASEKESFASDAVRNISLLAASFDITGYGSSRLRNFETIEIEAYQNVNMHFSLGYYVDYSQPEVKDFVMKYRALFNTEPGAYAFQGYDLTSCFTAALRQYGRHFTRSLENFDMKLLQSNMHFEKASPWGGYLNKATRNIVYLNDYSIACE